MKKWNCDFQLIKKKISQNRVSSYLYAGLSMVGLNQLSWISLERD